MALFDLSFSCHQEEHKPRENQDEKPESPDVVGRPFLRIPFGPWFFIFPVAGPSCHQFTNLEWKENDDRRYPGKEDRQHNLCSSIHLLLVERHASLARCPPRSLSWFIPPLRASRTVKAVVGRLDCVSFPR